MTKHCGEGFRFSLRFTVLNQAFNAAVLLVMLMRAYFVVTS